MKTVKGDIMPTVINASKCSWQFSITVKSIICLIILDSKETALGVFEHVKVMLQSSGLNFDNIICNSQVW